MRRAGTPRCDVSPLFADDSLVGLCFDLHMSTNFSLGPEIERFVDRCPEQSAVGAEFVEFLATEPRPFDRESALGHFTGSAWLVSADGQRCLLTHHRKLDRWLQLGGHADDDPDLAHVALREAEEESGLSGLSLDPAIFDLDRHLIPARSDKPAHWHYDVRFVVRAGEDERFEVSRESKALAWVEVASLVERSDIDESVRRMARRWLQRQAGHSAERS